MDICLSQKTKMNPYVYSKRRKPQPLAEEQAPLPATKTLGLVKSVLGANISSVLAFAIILLAAGSTASITGIVSTEIGGTLNILPVVHVAEARGVSEVLGDSTTVPAAGIINDSSLEAGTAIPTAKLSAKAVSFDSSVGRWDYTISYSAPNLSGSASITIGTYVVSSSLTATTGKVDTGAILKPSMVYYVTFWVSDGNGGQQAAATTQIKTGKGNASGNDLSIISPCQSQSPSPATSTPPSMPSSGNAISTSGAMFCLKTPDGKMICPRPPVCGQMGQHKGPSGNSSLARLRGAGHHLAALQVPLQAACPQESNTLNF